MKTVQMISVQPQIMSEVGDDEGMMEAKSVEHAQLTAPPSEHDPSPQTFETIETWNEHHLNLPLSRLVKDRPRLLEYGGVITDADGEASDNVSSDDLVLEIQGDSEAVGVESVEGGTDPNHAGGNEPSESEKIIDKASDTHNG